jgi:hypothetical protein
MHGVGSRNKLTPSHARHYPGDGLLDVLGRALCAVGCLPRKELHEAFELASRVRRVFPRGRVVDLCCGQGLVAWCMLLLGDDHADTALAVDVKLPANHGRVGDAVVAAFPQLAGRVTFMQARLQEVPLQPDDIVVSAHACGDLSDEVLARAAAVGARVAVLPCCHRTRRRDDLAHLPDVEDRALAIDRERALLLAERGLRVWTPAIPAAVSPKHRLVVAARPGADVDDDAAAALPSWR